MAEPQALAALAAAENELQQLRGLRAQLAAFINDPSNDAHTCRALAQHFGLPAPRQENQPHGR